MLAAPSLAPTAELVRSSHEAFDGTGYPDALSGDAIPLGARIIAVCDAFDAMTSDTPLPHRDAERRRNRRAAPLLRHAVRPGRRRRVLRARRARRPDPPSPCRTHSRKRCSHDHQDIHRRVRRPRGGRAHARPRPPGAGRTDDRDRHRHRRIALDHRSATAGNLGTRTNTVAGGTISGSLGQVQVNDARSAAAGAGWVASVISTAFTPPSGPTIGAAAVGYAAGPITKVGTATFTANDPPDLTGAVAAVTATGITGDNSATWNPTINVTVGRRHGRRCLLGNHHALGRLADAWRAPSPAPSCSRSPPPAARTRARRRQHRAASARRPDRARARSSRADLHRRPPRPGDRHPPPDRDRPTPPRRGARVVLYPAAAKLGKGSFLGAVGPRPQRAVHLDTGPARRARVAAGKRARPS